jgi:hypothetical protein
MLGEDSLVYDTPLLYVAIIVAVLIVACHFLGVFASRYYLRAQADGPNKINGVAANDGLSLLGFVYLLLAFTFSMSLSRYDVRRTLIYEEANCIGTAILRTDLYPDSARAALRKNFKGYVEARIAYYDAHKLGKDAVHHALAQSEEISHHIWGLAVSMSKDQPNMVRDNQMLPALNQMIDITNKRDANRIARVPDAIIYLLLASVFIGSFITGYDKKSWVALALFTVMATMTIYTILDLDHPEQGLIRSDLTHSKIVKLREMFR